MRRSEAKAKKAINPKDDETSENGWEERIERRRRSKKAQKINFLS